MEQEEERWHPTEVEYLEQVEPTVQGVREFKNRSYKIRFHTETKKPEFG